MQTVCIFRVRYCNCLFFKFFPLNLVPTSKADAKGGIHNNKRFFSNIHVHIARKEDDIATLRAKQVCHKELIRCLEGMLQRQMDETARVADEINVAMREIISLRKKLSEKYGLETNDTPPSMQVKSKRVTAPLSGDENAKSKPPSDYRFGSVSSQVKASESGDVDTIYPFRSNMLMAQSDLFKLTKSSRTLSESTPNLSEIKFNTIGSLFVKQKRRSSVPKINVNKELKAKIPLSKKMTGWEGHLKQFDLSLIFENSLDENGEQFSDIVKQ